MFVVYLTKYSGKKLPPYYIGSTSTEKIKQGYKGSVTSKKWRKIFYEELLQNNHLFEIEILSTHDNRKDALEAELKEQKLRDVVKSKDYFNESFASVNGFFGRDISGENHPMFGKKGHSSNTGKNLSEDHKKKIGLAHKGSTRTLETRKKIADAHIGLKHTEETKRKLSEMKIGKPAWNSGISVKKNCTCDHCGKMIAGTGNLKRHLSVCKQIIS
jgi:hypothetical protein